MSKAKILLKSKLIFYNERMILFLIIFIYFELFSLLLIKIKSKFWLITNLINLKLFIQ